MMFNVIQNCALIVLYIHAYLGHININNSLNTLFNIYYFYLFTSVSSMLIEILSIFSQYLTKLFDG